MSRQLPPNPNLEHLKNQAKNLLRDLQRQNPGSQLADALYAIAREYGFASWPKLKAHVESQQNPFVGLWIANVSKSHRHPANPFQRATIRIAVVGDTVTFTDSVVDQSGREEQRTNTVIADGREQRGDFGYVLTARWVGTDVLETIATQNDQVVGGGRYEVSVDGRTLTISAPEQIIVLERSQHKSMCST